MKLVIIGNGVAGVTTARYVAERDPTIEICIYSDEPGHYYARPKLIDLVEGRATPDKLPIYPHDWYVQRGIRTLLGCKVVAVHPDRHEVVLGDGGTDHYDKLVIATGACSWVPPLPGAQVSGVHTLRTLGDALALRARAQRAERAVVLGGGLLGLDTGMALSAHDLHVQIIEIAPRLLPLQLDAEGSALLQRLIEGRGVQVFTGEQCQRIEGHTEVERVCLKSGRVLACEMVVISAGVRPNLELAQGAGLAHNRGIIVDARLRTSDPDIYAVGDVVEFQGRVWAIIPAALAQAKVAAAQLTGDADTLYEGIVPSTTLKVAGIDLASIGEVNPTDEGATELRQFDKVAGVYRKLVLRAGKVVGAIALGEKSSVPVMTALITRQVDVSAHADHLLQEGFDLRSLL